MDGVAEGLPLGAGPKDEGGKFRLWGTLAVALTGGYDGGATLTGQIIGCVAIIGATFVLALILWIVLKVTMGIRVSEEAEIQGLDTTELGMEAYPDFSKG